MILGTVDSTSHVTTMDAAIERHRTVDNLTSLNKSSGLIFIRFIIIMIIDFF